MGEPDRCVKITTKKITARNLHEAAWEIPYCGACEQADKSQPLRFGWLKSFFETFTEHVRAVEYLKLHNSVHFFRFKNKSYLDLFLQANSGKRCSEVVNK
jgi:hypothetical protein